MDMRQSRRHSALIPLLMILFGFLAIFVGLDDPHPPDHRAARSAEIGAAAESHIGHSTARLP